MKAEDRAEQFRKHYDKAVALEIWCLDRVRASRPSGGLVAGAEIADQCGEHWNVRCREWAVVGRLCRQRAKAEDRSDHPVVARLLRGIADKLSVTNVSAAGAYLRNISAAIELIGWIPDEADTIEDKRDYAFEAISRMPLLETRVKRRVLKQTLSKPGRPSETRRIAAYAFEMRAAGLAWDAITKRLAPEQKGVSPERSIQREVQYLKALMKRHGL